MNNPTEAHELLDDFDYTPECPACGVEMEFEDCARCGGDGFHEHEADAEEPWGGYEDCEACGGKGGWWYCPNGGNHGH